MPNYGVPLGIGHCRLPFDWSLPLLPLRHRGFAFTEIT
jgi:hypothetical protein